MLLEFSLYKQWPVCNIEQLRILRSLHYFVLDTRTVKQRVH
jgi:hypothetical protein